MDNQQLNYQTFNVLCKKSEDTLNDINNILSSYRDKISASNFLAALDSTIKIFDICKENQCIITVKIEANEILEILNSQNQTEDLFNLFLKNDENYLNEVITNSRSFELLEPKLSHYNDAVTAYSNKAYYSAGAALFTIVDFLLSTITNNPTTATKERFTPLEDHLKDNEHFCMFVCTAFLTINTFFEYTSFSKDHEPNVLNRHWFLHGRYTKNITQYDCIKLFCLIHALLKAGMLYKSAQNNATNNT